MHMREVIYDTETTGKYVRDGDRVVEIGALELIDGVPTGRTFHFYLNPERHIPDEVVAIHGITNEKVANAPKFRDVLPEFLDFFRGAVAIAHNAEFDEGFLNNELKLAGHQESFWSIVEDTVDTMYMSRSVWREAVEEPADASVPPSSSADASSEPIPSSSASEDTSAESTSPASKVSKSKAKAPVKRKEKIKHSLDAVLDRCQVDRTERTFHGALLDSQLLMQAYLVMKERLSKNPTLETDVPRGPIHRIQLKVPLVEVSVSDEEQQLHDAFLAPFKPASSPPTMR